MKRFFLFFLPVLVSVGAMEEKKSNAPVKHYSEKEEKTIIKMISLLQACRFNDIRAEQDKKDNKIFLLYKNFQDDTITYHITLDKARYKLRNYFFSTQSQLVTASSNYCANNPLYIKFLSCNTFEKLGYLQKDNLEVLYTVCLLKWNDFMDADLQKLGKNKDNKQLSPKKCNKEIATTLENPIAVNQIVRLLLQKYPTGFLPGIGEGIREYLKEYHEAVCNAVLWRKVFLSAETLEEIRSIETLPLQSSYELKSIVALKKEGIRTLKKIKKEELSITSDWQWRAEDYI